MFDGGKWTEFRVGSEKLTEAWGAADGSMWALGGNTLLKWERTRRDFTDSVVGPRRCYDVATTGAGDFWIAARDDLSAPCDAGRRRR